MKRKITNTLLLLNLSALLSAGALVSIKHAPIEAKATSGSPTYSSSLPTEIDLKDNSDDDIRSYYANLNSLSDSERTSTNLLKNLKPILQDFTYYSYDNVWKIYEITDREWELSPANETTYGTYNESTLTISGYEYGSNSNPKNDPYVRTLYRNRDDDGITVESGRIKEWGSHTQTGGTNREHVWCQSRGFKAESGAEGPAGTDVHHLLSGDGYVNGKPHNNNPYGYVDPEKITIDSKDTYAYCEGNLAGSPLHASTSDESTVVFEPQDSDKGDIARACFYMVACYNNLAGETGVITQFNPNLSLANYATSNGNSEISSDTKSVSMGILSDLLEWNELDPVDEYEIHRNNLIYNNYQGNRNPFIDFPQWANLIWGSDAGTKSANPQTDKINQGLNSAIKLSVSSKTISLEESFELSATVADGVEVTWSVDDSSVVSISSTTGSKITVTALKEGATKITATVEVDGETYTKKCSVTVAKKAFSLSDIPLYVWIIAGVVVVAIIIIAIVIYSKSSKKNKKKMKSAVKKVVKKSSSSKKKK